MPMDYKYLELELDNVEAKGAGRVPQEMAKSPALAGDNIAHPWPDGIPRGVIDRKAAKTLHFVNAARTQVLPR